MYIENWAVICKIMAEKRKPPKIIVSDFWVISSLIMNQFSKFKRSTDSTQEVQPFLYDTHYPNCIVWVIKCTKFTKIGSSVNVYWSRFIEFGTDSIRG